MDNKQLRYLIERVRSQDYDRYLCTLFAPKRAQPAWFVLLAFNQEIVSISEVTTEEMTALIRFTWWREALDEMYGGQPVRQHPVALALNEVIHRYDLPRACFERLLEARLKDLEKVPFDTQEQFEAYLDDSAGALFQLMARCVDNTGEYADYCMALGRAWAMIGLLRSTLALAQHGRCLWPQDMLKQHGLNASQLFRLNDDMLFEAFSLFVKQLCEAVDNENKALIKMEKSSGAGLKVMRIFRWYLSVYLSKIKRLDHDLKTLPDKLHYIQLILLIKTRLMFL